MRNVVAAVAVLTLAGLGRGQDGATPFQAAQVVAGNQDRFDTTLDLDLDGDVDYLGNFQGLKWFENRGDGVPTTTHLLAAAANAMGKFCLADLDNDGHLDAVCFAGTTAYAILSRAGGPVVHATAISGLGFHPQAGDLQGDGTPEFVCISGQTLSVYEFVTASNTFQLVYSTFVTVSDLFIVDRDGDGKDEVWRFNQDWMWAMSFGPTWNSWSASAIANTLSDPVLPTVGDIDGDGDTDLVLFTDEGVARFVVFRRSASGLLTEEPQVLGGPATHLADVDGDGDLDGLCCGGGTGGGPVLNDERSDYMISFNDGTGLFAPARSVRGLGARQLAGCVDIDGDGDRDLVGGRTVIYNSGDISALFVQEGGAALRYETTPDVDRDLDADFNMVASGVGFSWRQAQGDGSFVSRQAGLGPGWSAVFGTGLLGDFDGDGDIDGLLQDIAGPSDQVNIHRNVGGVFTLAAPAAPNGLSMRPTSSFTVGNGTTWTNHWSFTSDWDGDGDIDCVVVDESNGGTMLFQNDGTGFFSTGPTLWPGVIATGFADFTGDGLPDLLGGTANDATVLHLVPRSATGFGAPIVIGSNAQRDERPGIIDIDGDGDLDILTSSSGGGVLLRNQGAGVFVEEAHDFAATRHNWWTFGDLDDNGTIDAISYQPYNDDRTTSSVILQNPDGTFAPPVVLVAAISGVADTDRDGDLDLVGDESIKNHTAVGSFGILRQFGQGTPGTNQVRPRINDIGVAAPGNPMIMRVSGMVGGAAGLWVLGIGTDELPDVPLPGMTLYIDQILSVTPFVAGGPAGVPGEGVWMVPWQMITGFGGLKLSSQAFCADALASQGWTQTNGKVMTLPF